MRQVLKSSAASMLSHLPLMTKAVEIEKLSSANKYVNTSHNLLSVNIELKSQAVQWSRYAVAHP